MYDSTSAVSSTASATKISDGLKGAGEGEGDGDTDEIAMPNTIWAWTIIREENMHERVRTQGPSSIVGRRGRERGRAEKLSGEEGRE